MKSSESAPGDDGDLASPRSLSLDWGEDDGVLDGGEDRSSTSDNRPSVCRDKTPPQASPVKRSRSASQPPSGSDDVEDDKKEGDEGDKRVASPRAKLVPASRHSFWSRAVPSKSKGSKAAEKGKWKGKGKGKPGKLASGGSIHRAPRGP